MSCSDDVVAPDELMAIVDEESVDRYEGDLFVFDATPPDPATGEFRALRDAFARAVAPVVSRITGKRVSTVDMRAFAYRVGHYLLPHSDHRDGLHRALAYAYYVLIGPCFSGPRVALWPRPAERPG